MANADKTTPYAPDWRVAAPNPLGWVFRISVGHCGALDSGRECRRWCIRRLKGHSSPAFIAVGRRRCHEASQSPLTLAAVTVAFIIMFTVNMLVSPPGGSSAEPVGPSAAPASSGPAQQTTSVVAHRPPQAQARGAMHRAFPNKVVYDGRTEGKSGAIAVAVLGDQAAAYFCDGRTIESWLRGNVQDPISRCGARTAPQCRLA